MYDIHCHMLPSLDDGPASLEDAISMAEMAQEDGIQVVVATPHAADILQKGGPDALSGYVEGFDQELRARGLKVRVLCGTECKLTPELPEQVVQGTVRTLNGSRYLLVELDFLQYSPYTLHILFQVQLARFVPVIAHPERQATILRRPQLAEELVSRGAVLQLTAGSLLGVFGKAAHRSAETLLRRGLVHVIASDAHAATGDRLPLLSPVLEAVQRVVGSHGAQLLLVDNPRAIVEDHTIQPLPATPHPSLVRRLFGGWYRGGNGP